MSYKTIYMPMLRTKDVVSVLPRTGEGSTCLSTPSFAKSTIMFHHKKHGIGNETITDTAIELIE
jgi:hypothetical protein